MLSLINVIITIYFFIRSEATLVSDQVTKIKVLKRRFLMTSFKKGKKKPDYPSLVPVFVLNLNFSFFTFSPIYHNFEQLGYFVMALVYVQLIFVLSVTNKILMILGLF